MEKRRQPEIIAGRVNGDGSIATSMGDTFTVTRTTAGTYVITFISGFKLIGQTVSDVTAGSSFTAEVQQTPTERSFTVLTKVASTAGLADQMFSFVAVGIQQ